MTSTRKPIETLPFEEALVLANKALTPYLGRDIGGNTGWVFNGGVPYQTQQGKLFYNLTIQPSASLNPVEEGELFYDGGIDAVTEFLAKIGILSIAHWSVEQDDEALRERLLAL